MNIVPCRSPTAAPLQHNYSSQIVHNAEVKTPGVSGAEEKEPGAKARDADADQRPGVVLEPEKLIQKFLWKNMWD